MDGRTKEGSTKHDDEQTENENKAESKGSSKNLWGAMENDDTRT
jgi:hypothetical protein